MSIHKSKGLEFPVCFLAGCSKRFNHDDTQKPALFHPSCGFGSIIRDSRLNCRFTTLPREAVRLETQKSMLSEEMRVLYVAMTRAKEKLYTVMSLSNPENSIKRAASMTLDENGKISPYEAMQAQSPAEWLLAAALRHPSCGELRKTSGIQGGVISDENRWEIVTVKAGGLAAVAQPQTEKTTREETIVQSKELLTKIESKLSYNYPFSRLSTLPSKVSVSEIAHGEQRQFSAERVRPSFLEKERLTSAEKGTAIHEFMQYADFDALSDINCIKSEIERLVRQKFLLPEQGEAVDTAKIAAFSASDIYKRVKNASKVWREFRFNFEIPAEEVFEDARGIDEKILIQGMADLVFEEAGGAVLLDYKTDRVSQISELAEKYRAQLFCYERAVKEILKKEVIGRYIYSFHLGEAIEIRQ
jgi:ATP-dependent helicase/nuclease subunit A